MIPIKFASSVLLLSFLARSISAAPLSASEADRFVDEIGVNIHLHYNDTIYNDFAKVRQALLDLGVRHVRDGLVDSQWQPYYDRHRQLAAAGIKATFITSLPPERLTPVAERVRDSVEAFEGPNEVNLNRWKKEDARNYQRALWGAVKSGPFARTPVVALSVTDFQWARELGDLSAWCDVGNAHPYPGGWMPENDCAWMRADVASGLELARANGGAHPVIFTETGYCNRRGGSGGHVPVSAAAAGVYLPRLYLNNHHLGVARTFWYELFNLHDRPEDQESNFGLYENDGVTPKPAGRALRHLVELLRDPGPAFSPAALDVEVSDPKVRAILFQKRSGEFWLALWRPVTLWDEARPYGQKQEVTPPATPCTVTLRGRVGAVRMHDQLDREHPVIAAIGNPSGFQLDLAARVVLLQIGAAP